MNSMVFEFMKLVLLLLLGIQDKQRYVSLLDIDGFSNKWESAHVHSTGSSVCEICGRTDDNHSLDVRHTKAASKKKE